MSKMDASASKNTQIFNALCALAQKHILSVPSTHTNIWRSQIDKWYGHIYAVCGFFQLCFHWFARLNKLCNSPSDLENVHTTYEATKIRPAVRDARVSRMRCSLFSSAIILLLTHKWPQYFFPTQPTNQYKSLTALFQIPTTSAFIHFHLLQKLSPLQILHPCPSIFFPPTLHLPSPPPLMPAINPQGGWNCPSQWKAPRWQPRLRYWPTADSQAGTELPRVDQQYYWRARWSTGQIHKMYVKEPTSNDHPKPKMIA